MNIPQLPFITIAAGLLCTIPNAIGMRLVPPQQQLTCGSPESEVAKYFYNKEANITSLFNAAKNNDELRLKHFITRVDVNTRHHETKGTPLHLAAYYGHVNIGEILLNNGAEVNIQNKYGYTPLHSAINSLFEQQTYDQAVKFVNLLLTHGALINIKDSDNKCPDNELASEQGGTPPNEIDLQIHQAIKKQCINEDAYYCPANLPINTILSSLYSEPSNKRKRLCLNHIHALLLSARFKEQQSQK
jgi:hypothetical protein